MTEIIPLKCSTVRHHPHDPCAKVATHVMVYSVREDGKRQEVTDAVCGPCGEDYLRRPSLQARLIPLKPETYGSYDIIGKIPLPDGSSMVLGFHEKSTASYVVTRLGGGFTGSGRYPDNHKRALVLLVEELAEAAGLVVQPAEPKQTFTPLTYAEVDAFLDGIPNLSED